MDPAIFAHCPFKPKQRLEPKQCQPPHKIITAVIQPKLFALCLSAYSFLLLNTPILFSSNSYLPLLIVPSLSSSFLFLLHSILQFCLAGSAPSPPPSSALCHPRPRGQMGAWWGKRGGEDFTLPQIERLCLDHLLCP